MEQAKLSSSKLFITTWIDPKKDDFDEKYERGYQHLQSLTAGLSEKEAHDALNNAVCKDKTHEELVQIGLLAAILTEPQNASKCYRDLTLVTRDGLGMVLASLSQLVVERWLKMADRSQSQVVWLLRELVRNAVAGVETLAWNLMRLAAGGDVSPRNTYLIESLLDIYIENRSWLEKYPLLLASVVYSYLRLIEDHGSPGMAALRQKEVNFTVNLLRDKFTDCLVIGRDLVRLLQNVARIPEFEQLWQDILHNPKALSSTFTGVLQMLQSRTSRRFLQSRLTPDMERKMVFLTGSVRFGNHKRYQDWFQRQYLAVPESQTLRCDLIRFIVGVIHPTNELLCSDIIPRWAVIGWLLTTCTSSVAASNAKLALFYDWLFFDSERDNIMNIEPAILVMHHSMRSHPVVTATLLDFLCRIIPCFYPPLQDKVRQGIYTSLRQILEKRVLPSLYPLFEHNKLDRELRSLVRETFLEFCFPPANATATTTATTNAANTNIAPHLSLTAATPATDSGSVVGRLGLGLEEMTGMKDHHHPHPMVRMDGEGEPTFSDEELDTGPPPPPLLATTTTRATRGGRGRGSRRTARKFGEDGDDEEEVVEVDGGNEGKHDDDDDDDDVPLGKRMLVAAAMVRLKEREGGGGIADDVHEMGGRGALALDDDDDDADLKSHLHSLSLHPEKDNEARCEAMERIVEIVMGWEQEVDEEEDEDDEDEDEEEEMVGGRSRRRRGVRGRARALAASLCRVLRPHPDLDPNAILPPKEMLNRESLEDSIGRPLFVLMRSLAEVFERGSGEGDGEDEDEGPDEESWRSRGKGDPLLRVLSELRLRQPEVGYLLLYYLQASAHQHHLSQHNITDADTARRRMKRRWGVYRGICWTIRREVVDLLLDDLQLCQEESVEMFCWLVGGVYSQFPNEAIGRADLLHLVVSTVDASQLRDLIFKVVQGGLVMFREPQSFLALLQASLTWETFEQVCLWQLVSAHGVPVNYVLPILPRLDHSQHSEALTAILLMLKQERPTVDLLRHVLMRDVKQHHHHQHMGLADSGSDGFVVSALQSWCRDHEERLGEAVGQLMATRCHPPPPQPTHSTSPGKRKRGGGANASIGAGRHHHTTHQGGDGSLNNSQQQHQQEPSGECILAHLDRLRSIGGGGSCRQLCKTEALQKALLQARHSCTDAQKARFADLFALLEQDNETVTSNTSTTPALTTTTTTASSSSSITSSTFPGRKGGRGGGRGGGGGSRPTKGSAKMAAPPPVNSHHQRTTIISSSHHHIDTSSDTSEEEEIVKPKPTKKRRKVNTVGSDSD